MLGVASPREGSARVHQAQEAEATADANDTMPQLVDKPANRKKPTQFSLASQMPLKSRKLGGPVTGRIINFEDYVVDMPLMHKLDAGTLKTSLQQVTSDTLGSEGLNQTTGETITA